MPIGWTEIFISPYRLVLNARTIDATIAWKTITFHDDKFN